MQQDFRIDIPPFDGPFWICGHGDPPR
jgi:hypothetical protein